MPGFSEFDLIEKIRSTSTRRAFDTSCLIDIGDDAAVLEGAGQLVVCKDLLNENIHFRRDWTTAEDLGWKALAVNLSDLAAMGATPRGCLLGLGLPRDIGESWLDGFLDGMLECGERFGCPLIGGDTTATDAGIQISVTALGKLNGGASGRPLLRSGARPGDGIYLSGLTGLSARGLRLLEAGVTLGSVDSEFDRHCLLAHFRPQPQLDLGKWLRDNDVATACIDVSDGLVQDLRHILMASEVGAEIDAQLMTCVIEKRWGEMAVEEVLTGGEDYELCFTVSASKEAFLLEKYDALSLFPIGVTTPEPGLRLRHRDGTLSWLDVEGFDHFRREESL